MAMQPIPKHTYCWSNILAVSYTYNNILTYLLLSQIIYFLGYGNAAYFQIIYFGPILKIDRKW